MALTDAEKQELLNEMKASSNDVSELEIVDSLDGIVSLPAMKGEELVNAPIALLRKPAEEAAKVANAAASNAEQKALQAENSSIAATNMANLAKDCATEATNAAQDATEAKEQAKEVIETHEATALAARNGATARFGGFMDNTWVPEDGDLDIMSDPETTYDSSRVLFHTGR